MLATVGNFFISRLSRLSKRARTLLTSFAITATIASFLVVVGVVTFNTLTAPPVVQSIEQDPPPARPSSNSTNSDPLDTSQEEEDDCPWPTVFAPEWATDEDRRENFWTFLIVGINNGTNANTIMVASYCANTHEAHLVSIPRDVPVNATRNGRKFASSYMIGARNGGMEGGMAQMRRDVQTVIGFVPDFYVLFNYEMFATVIDAVGGIYVDVPIRMRYDDPIDRLRIDIEPGLQHMDGITALHFSRFRQGNPGFPSLPNGDLDRVRNQQEVIRAVIDRLLRVENLNPMKIAEFVGIFNDNVYTSLPYRNMPFFANQLRFVDGVDALHTHTLPTVGRTVNRESYQFLVEAEVVRILNETVNPFYQDLSASDLRIVRN